MTTTRRVEGLDGLRAIAILFVLLDHGAHSPGLPGWFGRVGWLVSVSDLAGLGVRLFFVLSGFIITHLLLLEDAQAGRISLRQFWVRRALRILPPLLGYLLAVMVLSCWVPSIRPAPVEYLMSTTFTWDLLSASGSWYLGHTWSLSIEEQFYLLWPCLFVAAGTKRLSLLALAYLLVLPAMTLITQWWLPERAGWLLPANGCYLAAGCGLALLRASRPRALDIGHKWTASLVPAAAVSVVLAAPLVPRLLPAAAHLHHLVVAPCLALLVNHCIDDQGLIKRVLTLRPVVFTGVLSYSIYLWQQLFLGRYGSEWWQAFPGNVPALGAAVLFSYLFLEKPFLLLRQKFRRVAATPA